MALEAVTPRQREQRTLPDRTGQRGQRTAAAWSSRAGYTQGPRPRLRGPWALILALLGVLMLRGVGGSGCGSPLLLTLVKPASAMSVRKDEIPQQSSAPLEGSLQQKLCLPGEAEKNHCTPTKDTECQCKPGTFRGEDAPEFCQKCSTRCPDGKVMVTHCNPWSNIKCVDQESGREADRITPSPEMQQAGCLLEPAAPEGSQRRRWLLVPTDGTQSLKLFFSDFAAIFSL